MSPLLQNLSEKINEQMLKSGIKKTVSANEHIFVENDPATFLPIVLKGKVKMVRFPEVGKEVIIGIFQDGEIFAIPPALDGKKFPATAIAMEETRLLLLPRPAFLQLMKESSEFSATIMARMCGLLRDRTETAQIFTMPSAEKRVGTVLLRLANENDGTYPTKIALRRQDIAEMSGLTVETTIRAIRSLAKREYVEIIRGKIIVKNTAQLEKYLR